MTTMTKPIAEIADGIAKTMADLYDLMIDLTRFVDHTSPEENGITPAGANEIAAVCKMLSDACGDWAEHGDGFLSASDLMLRYRATAFFERMGIKK
jgi:hypothetical protein